MAKSKASGTRQKAVRANITYGKKKAPALPVIKQEKVKFWPLYYLAAFLIPALLTLAAYAYFGMYPFNERSVLALDLNAQYIYYFEAFRDAFRGDGTIFYNWSRNLSGEFMGILGYYVASPFSWIIVAMPRSMILEAMMIMQLCKVGAAGLTFNIYIRKSKNTPALQSVLFSTMYAMMSYVMIQLIDPMWIDGAVFLPLIILGVEYLIDDGRKINYIIPLAIMFVAEFYIGYMIAIFVALYFFYYLIFGTKRKYSGFSEYAKTFGVMAVSTIVVLMLSIFMILPVYNGLSMGKFNFSKPDYSYKHMFELIELIPTLLPNQYYSVNVDENTRMYGRPEIYSGVLTLVLVPLYFLNKKIKRNRKLGQGLLMFIMLISMYVKPINMMWHGGQDPNWLPYRYSFIVSFILVAMAAEVFANLDGYKLPVYQPIGVFAVLAVLVYIFYLKMPSFNYNEDRYNYVAVKPYKTTETYHQDTWTELWLGTLAIGLILAAFYLIYVYMYSHTKSKASKTIMTVACAAVVFFEAGYNGYDTFKKVNKEVAFSDRSTYEEILSAPDAMKTLDAIDSGFYRAEKTYQRCVNDNMAYGLKGISHSSSVMNAKAINFIEALGYFTQSYETQYKGNTPVADSLLGIKYVLNDPVRNSGNRSLLGPTYVKVGETKYINNVNKEAQLDIYENPDALSIGYAASSDMLKLGHLGNDNQFNSMNIYLSTLTGNTAFETKEDGSIVINDFKKYFVKLEPEAYEGDTVYDPAQVRYSIYTPTDERGLQDPSRAHICYDAVANAADPVVNMHITAVNNNEIYLHTDTEFTHGVNIWVSSEQDEYGNFINHKEYGSYNENHLRPIARLGSYPAGTKLEIRFTIQKTSGSAYYTGVNEHFMFKQNGGLQIYAFDYDAFHEDIEKLKQNQWNIDAEKSNDRYLTGTVNIPENSIFYTTIPYEKGWSIKVDGKKVDNLIVSTKLEDGTTSLSNTDGGEGEIALLQATIGVKLPPGEHTISMKYTPPGFMLGIFTLILGIAVLVMFYIYDRKHNEVLIERQKERERRKLGLPEEEPEEEAPKKKVKIIKSKGAPTEDAEEKPAPAEKEEEKPAEEESADDDEKPAQPEETSGTADESSSETVDDTAEEEPEKPEKAAPAKNNSNKPKNGGKKNNNSGKKKKKKK